MLDRQCKDYVHVAVWQDIAHFCWKGAVNFLQSASAKSLTLRFHVVQKFANKKPFERQNCMSDHWALKNKTSENLRIKS